MKAKATCSLWSGYSLIAYRLQKYTSSFDREITDFLRKHPGAPNELKTKALINGSGGWSKIDATERKQFLGDVCHLAIECARLFVVAFSFNNFRDAVKRAHRQPFRQGYWLGAAMFIAALIQQKRQKEKKNKGLTVLICDDNKREMENLSDSLYNADPWFDPIYQTSSSKGVKSVGKKIANDERFDQIINSAFAIKSHHSSLIQVADAVAYVYRRHLELKSAAEVSGTGSKDMCRARQRSSCESGGVACTRFR